MARGITLLHRSINSRIDGHDKLIDHHHNISENQFNFLINMQAIFVDFIVFFSLLSLISITNPQFLLARANSGINESKDYEALLAIKAEISSDPHSVLTSWNNTRHFCQWEGVTCGRRHQRVVRLGLYSMNLVGTLSPFIGNISFLHTIDLYNNSFRGDIPHQISHLHKLRELDIARNSFEGEIPANLSRCFNLRMLGLSYNKLVGKISVELASLPNLIVLDLTQNHFRGRLQDIGIGNMSTSLQELYLYENHFQGSIPDDIGRLKRLGALALGENNISGTIPTSLFNLSNMYNLFLSSNPIQGHLPQDLGLCLPQLRYLSISDTFLTGKVPTSLSNLSKLENLAIQDNSFTGRFSLNGNNLPHFWGLNMDFALSFGGEVRDLSFLDTLTNCTNLKVLIIGGNNFTGTFPRSILNLSTSLQVLDIDSNHISGHLPLGLGKFVNLYGLDFSDNHFTGLIPPDVGKLERMETLYFAYNNLSGEVPSSLGNMTYLDRLWMSFNNFEGSLPKSLGKCQNLEDLSFSYNKLGGVLPVEVCNASNLIYLDLTHNNLEGSFPLEIYRLKNLVELDVSENMFSGEIPNTLGGCTSLTSLSMSVNSFVGSIPESLSPLKSIQQLDLSSNNLSGQIPRYFSTWPYLLSLNLSFNNLEGEVPLNGVFSNISALLIVGNSKLCGGALQLHLPKCPPQIESKKRRLSLAIILVISIACVLVILLSLALFFYLVCSSKKMKGESSELQNIRPFLEVSYQMLSRATNGFSSSNLIGGGGFGNVYKGILHQDDTELVVAVKVMNLHNERASKSFIAECRALRNIRHRNLVKVITACSSIDSQRNTFKALVYEFMPGGSLESRLHSNSRTSEEGLSLFQRLSIIIDVAFALEYLHTECDSLIIHCDLKPSNILLDGEMTAHVGDFGLTKFLSGASISNTTNQTSSTQVRGTVGYAAPEYGLGSNVSLEGDIYSFGIIVLEMMTSKKPTDQMFNNGLNLHGVAKSALPNQVMEIIDKKMLDDANMLPARTSVDIKKMECIKSLIMIGVQCSLEQPQQRMSIKDIVNELKSIKKNLIGR